MRERPAGHLPETDRPARPEQQTADERTVHHSVWKSPSHGRVILDGALPTRPAGSETENVVFQAGALANEGAAEEVLTVWRAEGRSEPMAVNFVPLYRSVQE